MKNLFFSMFFLLSLLFLIAHVTDATITCGTVTGKAAACLSFATGKDAAPSTACCGGLQQLAQGARTVQDKKDICNCLKNAVKNIKGVQDKFLQRIPTACHIKVGFPVSLSTSCDT